MFLILSIRQSGDMFKTSLYLPSPINLHSLLPELNSKTRILTIFQYLNKILPGGEFAEFLQTLHFRQHPNATN